MVNIVIYFLLGSIVVSLFMIFSKLCEICVHLSAIRRKADLYYSILDEIKTISQVFRKSQIITFEKMEEERENVNNGD